MIQLKWREKEDYYLYSHVAEMYWYVGHIPIPDGNYRPFAPPGAGTNLSKKHFDALLAGEAWAVYEDYLQLPEGL